MAEESKRLPYGLIAATVILLGVWVGLKVFAPQYFEAPAESTPAPQQETPQAAPTPAEGLTAEARRERTASATEVQITTDEFVAKFSSLNTGLTSLQLESERYRTEGRRQELVTTDREEYFPYKFRLPGVRIPESAVWEAEQISPREVHFRWQGDGVNVTRKIEAGEGPYQLWSTITVQNEGQDARDVGLVETAHHYVTRAEEEEGIRLLGFKLPGQMSRKLSRGLCYGEDEIREPRGELETMTGLREGVRFAAIENTYFTLALAAPDATNEKCRLLAEDWGHVQDPHGTLFNASLVLPNRSIASGESTTFRTLAYAGPKDIEALQKAGNELSEVVDLGWFGFLARGLIKLLRFVHQYVGSWGIAIIVLTFLVKLLLYPLTEKSFQSMAKMRVLKPEMDRINELYGDDREKKGAAIMELYKKHQINPVGGCLPSLLQMPVWIALYQSLSTNIELFHAPFAVWANLSSPDPYFVLPLIVGGLMFVQQKMTPSTMDPVQAKIMLYMMPTMITAFMLFLPAGLCLYMVTNSTLGIAQQRSIQWRLDRTAARAAASGSESTPGEEDLETPDPGTAGSSSVVSTRRAAGRKKRSQRGRA